jgi:hypothetical protein
MSKKRKTQNITHSNICQSNSNDTNAKSVALSREFIDTFTKIIFCEK